MTQHQNPKKLSRTPPAAVRYTLAKEVGFGCPVPDCASPYLEWHHFDPEWHVLHHHDPAGMIALCHEHHAKAGAGAYTLEQVRSMKSAGSANTEKVAGRFDWLRNDLMLVSGGCTFHETLLILQIGEEPTVWFSRDDEKLLRLNLNLPGKHGSRLQMRDNFWFNLSDASQVICPTGGRTLEVKYPDGDRLSVEFREVGSRDEWLTRFPKAGAPPVEQPFPVTIVDVGLRLHRLGIDFKSKGGGSSMFGGQFSRIYMSHSAGGIKLS